MSDYKSNTPFPGRFVAVHPYLDESGNLLFESVRFEPKAFKQRRPNPEKPGKWLWNLEGVRRVLYRLPELNAAIAAGQTIHVVEGEKDVDTLIQHGFAATCNPLGANANGSTWLPEYTECLGSASCVVVIADKDDTGRGHALHIAKALAAVVPSVKFVEMPDVRGNPVKDASDFFAAGVTKEDFRAIVDGAPEFTVDAAAPTEEESPVATDPNASDIARLVQEFGPPFFKSTEGQFTGINESFWAGLYADENTVLYEPDERGFYAYDSSTGLYLPESEDAIRCKLAARMLEVARECGVPKIEHARTATKLKNIVSHLRGIVEHRGAFTQRQPIVHLANGVIVFRDGDADFVGFSPEFYSRNASPIVFDPDATCPRFMNELLRPGVHPEDVALIQKVGGMSMLGRNRAQRMLILDGEAGRGKTQLANVFQGIIGHANCTQLRTQHLGGRFETFKFLKKTLLVGVDVEPSFLSTKGAAVLKGLVGGDWLDAEQKGGTGSFPVQGVFNVCITSNSRLRVRLSGDVGAWRRRLIIVRFESPAPAKKIPEFGEFLVRTEGAGILNWMLDGAGMVMREIPDDGGDLVMTKRQRGIVDSLLAESDSLRHFLLERVRSSEFDNLTVQEIIEEYASYCPSQGWNPLPITEIQHSLEGLMLELFGVAKTHSIDRDGKNQRGFRGVNWNEPQL